MTASTILYEVRDAIAFVTLNRPEALNAYNVAMRDELFGVLSAVQTDEELRALVLRGAGRAFCAGADLTEFGTAPSPTGARRIRFARDTWALLNGLEIPSVVALHGFALGAGLEMALFCDFRLAAEGTQFGLPEVQLGLIPAAGGTQTLPRVVGPGVALDLLLSGRRIDAQLALRWRLISRIVPPDRLDEEAEALAHQLASLDPVVLRAVRRAVREGSDLPLDLGLRLEARLAAGLRATHQSAEATE